MKNPLGEMRHFTYLTDDIGQQKKLSSLIVEKSLSQYDLVLILSTINFNRNAIPEIDTFVRCALEQA